MDHPLLMFPEEILIGYAALEAEEDRFARHAVRWHTPMVAHWLRLLTLLHAAVMERKATTGTWTVSLDQELRLRFVAASAGTAKVVLDAALAGYYTQALALVRHLFETWIRLCYLRLRPEMAERWYEGEGGQKPIPPDDGAIHRTIRKNGRGNDREKLERVLGTIKQLNTMAHPSHHTLQQTVGARENQYNVGANYDPDLCPKTLGEGAAALTLVLDELARDINPSDGWLRAFLEAQKDYKRVLAEEAADHERRQSGRVARGTGPKTGR